jgi:hypothetical protein
MMKIKPILFAIILSQLLVVMITNAQSVITMNEIFTRGVAGNIDWIELYNSSSSPVNISGYKIYDIGGQSGTKGKKLFPSGTIIPAKGFTVVIVDTASFAGDTTGFGLSNNGETVWLENASGTIIDTVAIPALGADTSYARYPDGSNFFIKASPVTRGKTNGLGTFVKHENTAVSDFLLEQNYPNPFNPTTTINYRLAASAMVTLTVFDIVGREVAVLVNERQNAGSYAEAFDASALSSGLYLYQLKAGKYSEIKKMVLVR